jgi:hypothetical protein
MGEIHSTAFPGVLRVRRRARLPLIAALLFAGLAACASENWFHFEGDYEAEQSGYRLSIVSRGFVASGYDVADHAFTRVQVCPSAGGAGRPFRFSLAARPQAARLFESEDMLTANATWNENLLRAVLRARGYSEPSAAELAGSFRVISNSLSGPKGVILEGQIDSVKVRRAKAEYISAQRKDRPLAEWVAASELSKCDALK